VKLDYIILVIKTVFILRYNMNLIIQAGGGGGAGISQTKLKFK
jgi:hypothetical protein